MGLEYYWDDRQRHIVAEKPDEFDLEQTLECGQCFRWQRETDGSFSGIAFTRAINVAQVRERLIFSGCTANEFEGIWKVYFDLERDYGTIVEKLASHDAGMREAAAGGAGIRLLRQDPWETLVSFIISQNANIPRIKKCVASLCAAYGEPVQGGGGKLLFAFPKPEALGTCSPASVDACRLGYRAGYILDTAARVAADGGRTLYQAQSRSADEAETYLLELHGVGPKVADCVMLFGMGFYDRFPTDVWIRRAMARLYGLDENNTKEIIAYAKSEFGELAGFAQQYLFQYARLHFR